MEVRTEMEGHGMHVQNQIFLWQNGMFQRKCSYLCVITIDGSLALTAAIVSEGGREDGYRTVLEIIARSTLPCIGVFDTGDSLALTAGGRMGSWGYLVVLLAWPNSMTTRCLFYFLEWIRVFAELSVAVIDKLWLVCFLSV